MPWCPKCKSEYRPGYTVCSECGLPLVKKREDLEKASGVFSMDTKATLRLLTVTPDEDVLIQIRDLLTNSEIPFLVTPYRQGGYGSDFPRCADSGECVLVDQHKLDLARELLAFYLPDCPMPGHPGQPEASEASQPEEGDGYSERYQRRGQRFGTIVSCFLGTIILVLGAFVFWIYHS